ncbi:MAG: DUF1328 domain-containing protein, partial [Vicinamibacterales bacterium]
GPPRKACSTQPGLALWQAAAQMDRTSANTQQIDTAQFLLSHDVEIARLCCRSEEGIMLHYALVFLVVALIAGLLGVSGVAAMATQIAYVLFVIAIVLFLVHLLSGRRTLAP